MPHVVVVGGGISGLSAALELQDRGLEVTLIEASERFGGLIHTERIDDLVIDAGPDSFLSSKPGGLKFVERLGLSERLVNTRSDGGGTYILHNGELKPLPEGITLLVPTQIEQIANSPLLDRAGKLRLLADYLIPARRRTEDESVASFMTRRVGRQAFENLAEPLLSGIYAGDARQLSILSTFPRLRDVERRRGGLIRGALAQRAAAKSPASGTEHTPFVSLTGGLAELIEGTVDALSAAILRTGVAVTALEPVADSGYRVRLADNSMLDADGVILATPAPVTADLMHSFATQIASELRQIPYVSSATVSMEFRKEDIAGKQLGRGFVVPRVEGRALTAVTWSSNKFAGRTPPGMALLRGFVGRAGQEEHAFLSDDDVIDLVRSDLADICGITADPVFVRVYRWHDAMPQYVVGHRARLDRIDDMLARHPSLALTGNAYLAVGIPDCITNSMAEASRLVSRIAAGKVTHNQRWAG